MDLDFSINSPWLQFTKASGSPIFRMVQFSKSPSSTEKTLLKVPKATSAISKVWHQRPFPCSWVQRYVSAIPLSHLTAKSGHPSPSLQDLRVCRLEKGCRCPRLLWTWWRWPGQGKVQQSIPALTVWNSCVPWSWGLGSSTYSSAFKILICLSRIIWHDLFWSYGSYN